MIRVPAERPMPPQVRDSSHTAPPPPPMRSAEPAPSTGGVETHRITILGNAGNGKTTQTVLMLDAAMSGALSRYDIFLGDGRGTDRTIKVVSTLAELIRAGEPIPATNDFNDLAFTVHPKERPDRGALVRWLDPQGEFVCLALCGEEQAANDEVIEHLVRVLQSSSVVVFVVHPLARHFSAQIEVLLRGIDRVSPRFQHRTGFEQVSVAVLLSHWGEVGGDVSRVLDARFPGATARLRHSPLRVGLFGVDCTPGVASEHAAAMEFILDGVLHAQEQHRRGREHEAAAARRVRRRSVLRRVGGAALALCGLAGVAGAGTFTRDAFLVHNARAQMEALAADDHEGRRAVWAGVAKARLLPAGHPLAWLEPGQGEAASSLADLDPVRRAFVMVLGAPTAAERILATAAFLGSHASTPLGASAYQAGLAAAADLLEHRLDDALPSHVDPDLVARSIDTTIARAAAGADAVLLARASARMREAAHDRAACALLARLDARAAEFAQRPGVPPPLAEEAEARVLCAARPDSSAAIELGRHLHRLESLRALRGVVESLDALPVDADPALLGSLDQQLAAVSTVPLAGSRFAGEPERVASALARARALLDAAASIRGAIARTGLRPDRLEDDVVMLAAVADVHADHPQVGRVWLRIAELLEGVDGRIRTTSDKRIVLPDARAFRAFDAAARSALERAPSRVEAIRRVLEHHLRAVGFRCPRCSADTRAAQHLGCGGTSIFREGRVVCTTHPTLELTSWHCSCGYTWRDE